MNGTPGVLIDGVMTNVQVEAGQPGSPGRITVTGKDLTKVMDLVDFSGLPYPAMPVPARVAADLRQVRRCSASCRWRSRALFLDVPIPIERIPAPPGHRLQYLQRMAKEVGYVFYIEPGPAPGMNIAYLGPEIKVGDSAAGAQRGHGLPTPTSSR